jgi:FkbM family methyltransferase
MSFKQYVKEIIRSSGWHVRRRKSGRQIDPYHDQKELLAKVDVRCILDVGANVGQTAQRYRKLFPDATIHSLEPFPDVFRTLSESCAGDPAIRPHRLALADSDGVKRFYISEHDEWGSLSPVAPDAADLMGIGGFVAIATRSEIEVPTLTLDHFCAEQGISSMQILKMDIQGGELAALRGAEGLLASRSIDLIYSEVFFKKLYADQGSFFDLGQFLQDHGYPLYGLYNHFLGKHDALTVADAIWVSPRLWESLG